MIPHQLRLRLAVPHLLPPVGADAAAVAVPDERRRREADRQAARLQPPADIDVVPRRVVRRIEAADRPQGVTPVRHVAARDMFRGPFVNQHVRRSARCARDALRQPRIVLRHDVRTARASHVGAQERLNEVGQPGGIDFDVGVGIGDHLARCRTERRVAGGAQSAGRRIDHGDTWMRTRDRPGRIR